MTLLTDQDANTLGNDFQWFADLMDESEGASSEDENEGEEEDEEDEEDEEARATEEHKEAKDTLSQQHSAPQVVFDSTNPFAVDQTQQQLPQQQSQQQPQQSQQLQQKTQQPQQQPEEPSPAKSILKAPSTQDAGPEEQPAPVQYAPSSSHFSRWRRRAMSRRAKDFQASLRHSIRQRSKRRSTRTQHPQQQAEGVYKLGSVDEGTLGGTGSSDTALPSFVDGIADVLSVLAEQCELEGVCVCVQEEEEKRRAGKRRGESVC